MARPLSWLRCLALLVPVFRAGTRPLSPSAARLLLALFVLGPALGYAQCPGLTTQVEPMTDEQLPIGDTAVALTPAKYQAGTAVASVAVVSVRDGDITYRLLGTPTATLGHPATGVPATTFPICGIASIKAFRAIRQTTDATLFVTYYKLKSP